MKLKRNSTWTDRPAARIARLVLQMQEKFALIMNPLMNRIPATRMKLLLFVSCLIGAFGSAYVSIRAFPGKPFLPHVDSVSVLRIGQPRFRAPDPQRNFMNELEAAQHRLDSIRSFEGFKTEDSLNLLPFFNPFQQIPRP